MDKSLLSAGGKGRGKRSGSPIFRVPRARNKDDAPVRTPRGSKTYKSLQFGSDPREAVGHEDHEEEEMYFGSDQESHHSSIAPASDVSSAEADGFLSVNVEPHPYSNKQRRPPHPAEALAQDVEAIGRMPSISYSDIESNISHEVVSLGEAGGVLSERRNKLGTSVDIATARSAFTRESEAALPDVRNWPESCPVVHLDIANDFSLSGKRQFIRTAFFFYWFLIASLALNAGATLVSAMTSPVGGNPFVMEVAFLGFTAGYFWFFFAHFYVVYVGLRFKRRPLLWAYFFHTLAIMFLAIYMLLVSLSDIMVLSQPLQPGSPVPIPLDTVFPMALEACSVALWFSVVIFTALLIRSTYFWYTLPPDVELLMEEEEAARPDLMEQRVWFSLKYLLRGERDGGGGDDDDDEEEQADGRNGGGWPCELVLRPDALSVSGVLILSRHFLHFCATKRVFEHQAKRVIAVEDIQDIGVANRQQLMVRAANYKAKIRLKFATTSLCRRVFRECEQLWKEDDEWIWERGTAVSQEVHVDFVSDQAMAARIRKHRNRARDRQFSPLPPSIADVGVGEVRMAWQLGGHMGGPHPVLKLYEPHALTEEDWASMLGGVTLHTITPGHAFCWQGGDPHLWHVVSGEVKLVQGRATIASAGEDAIVGISPFLMWSLGHNEGDREWDEDDSASIASEGDHHNHQGAMQGRRSRRGSMILRRTSLASVSTVARRKGWRWVAGDKPVTAFRFSYRWLALALEQNPSLRAPFNRYLCHLLADRVEKTDRHIVSLAEREMQKRRNHEDLVRLLDGSPLVRSGPSAQRAATYKFVTSFNLLESETLVERLACTSYVSLMGVNDKAPPETRHGTLFVSFHYLCFEAQSTLMRQQFQWQVPFDDLIDMRPALEQAGVEFFFRNSRKVVAWGFDNPGRVVETLTIVWKDLDISASFHPPLPTFTLAYGRASQARHSRLSMQHPVVDLGDHVGVGGTGHAGGGEGEGHGHPALQALHRAAAPPTTPRPGDVAQNVSPDGFLITDPGYGAQDVAGFAGGDGFDDDLLVASRHNSIVSDATTLFTLRGDDQGRNMSQQLDFPLELSPDVDALSSASSGGGGGGGARSSHGDRRPNKPDGILDSFAAMLAKRRSGGYDALDEGGAGEGAGKTVGEDEHFAAPAPGPAREGAWHRLSLDDKESLFRRTPAIGMLRNQVVLSQALYNHKDPGLYFIEQGMVRVQYRVCDGKARVVMQQLGQGTIFGAHGFVTCLAPRCSYVVDSDRATVKHITATQLFARLEAKGMETTKAKLYRELALELSVTPSTMVYAENDLGVEERWCAFPY